ncbi:MAG: flagellar basal body L-ring protein FlgH [Deltaproteobacteria bacterium]|nr:flagellar basal body L-ring protein FlgH [Deltaproteobacteria bacterium]
MVKTIIFLLAGFLLFGCAHHEKVAVHEQPLPEVKPSQIVTSNEPVTSGSLWTDGQGDLFSDNKARSLGDILTVVIYEQASASKEASTETDRKSSASADITKFLGLEEKLADIFNNSDVTDLINASYSSDFEGGGTTTRKEDLVATLTTQVVGVLPNGNLGIAGKKKVTVNNEDQYIMLTGIVRTMDITADNLIDSKYILDAEISYTGKGIISDRQKPGWMTRALDHIWPF